MRLSPGVRYADADPPGMEGKANVDHRALTDFHRVEACCYKYSSNAGVRSYTSVSLDHEPAPAGNSRNTWLRCQREAVLASLPSGTPRENTCYYVW